jgi:hypothetical protein
MTSTRFIATALVLIALAVGTGYYFSEKESGEGEDVYVVDSSDMLGSDVVPQNPLVAPAELSQDEIRGLLLMREEEKLARDVYEALGAKWGLAIFSNIAESEQTHTDAVAGLLQLYGLDDPVVTDTRGAFEDQNLQSLYDSLLQKGEASLMDALIVGATVEDLDIHDLERLMEQTSNEDILAVYRNLQKGSRNHLRAYYKQITSRGGEYQPVYISQEMFASIVNSPQEKGRL